MNIKSKSLVYYIGSSIVVMYYRWKYKCTVVGKENIPTSGDVILASNHVTAYDPIFLGDVAKPRKIFYMAKEELFKNKFIGAILRSLGAFPVSRGTGGEDALGNAQSILDQKGVLLVFIEGTRSKDGELLRPKTGVPLLSFKNKTKVVPIAVVGQGGKRPQKGIKCMIKIGKPIEFDELNMQEPSSMHYRRGAKYIMSKISELRDEAIEILGEE